MATIQKIGGQFRLRYKVYPPRGDALDRSRRYDKRGQAQEDQTMAGLLEARTKRQEYTQDDLTYWQRLGLLSDKDAQLLRLRESGQKSIRQAADEYFLTLRKKYLSSAEREERERRSEAIVKFFGPDTLIASLGHFDGEKLVNVLLESRKVVTARKYLQDLKRMFRLQVAAGALTAHPFAMVDAGRVPRVQQIKHVALSNEEIKHVLQKARERDKLPRPWLAGHLTLFLLIFFGTGLRRKEALAARWENIDWQDRSLLAAETKSGKERRVGLGKMVVLELMRHRKPEGFILPRLHANSVTRAIGAHFRECGHKMRLHDARHTYVTRLLDLGVNQGDAMGRSGHSDTKMLSHYTHPEFGEVFEDDFGWMKE